MSLLDKQEVQKTFVNTALRARKWSGFICKRASEDTTLTIALGLLKKKKKKEEECQITIFFLLRAVRTLNCYTYSNVIH